MGLKPDSRTDPYRRRHRLAELDSAAERLVCMYLDRVPAAYADEIGADLRMSQSALEPVLASLHERDIVRERDGLYALSVALTD